MPKYADRVKETTTTAGTGTLDLAGAVTGYRTFVAGVGTGAVVYYCVTNGTDWEVGQGTVTDASPDTLSRTRVLSSSTGSAINFGAGSKDVFLVAPADIFTTLDKRAVDLSSLVGDGSADDTSALQALVTAYPDDSVFDGGGKLYKITALTFPASNRRVFRNFRFTVPGDTVAISGTGLNYDCRFEHIFITASSQTTAGRRIWDFTNFSQCTFRHVRTYGVDNISDHWYATADSGGSAPYYNRWEECYGGTCRYWLNANETGGVATGVNASTWQDCRIQPGARTAIKVSQRCQALQFVNIAIEGTGTGFDIDGLGTTIIGGWLEGLATGINITSNASGTVIDHPYFSSNTTKISDAGKNTVILGHRDDVGVVESVGARPLDTAPPTTGWSWHNQQSATITESPTNLFLSTTADQLCGRTRTVPSAPYTITMCTEYLLDKDANAAVALAVTDGTQLVTLRAVTDTGVPILSLSKWNSVSSWNSHYVANYGVDLRVAATGRLWFRLYDNNTNRIWSFSYDGVNFIQVDSHSRTDFFTATTIGFFAWGTPSYMTVWSWKQS